MAMNDFWAGADERIKPHLRSYASFFDGTVEEVGTGANAGLVKVRKPQEDTALADLPWASVYGSTPAVGAVVLTLVSFTGGRRVIMGGTSSGGGTVADASTTTKGITKLSSAPVTSTNPIAVGDNDARVPTTAENDALQGTSGTPSGTNRYVTDADARNTNARTPTAHASTHQPGGTDAMAVDAAAATGSLRTLGTGATQAVAGNDTRLSNARTPTAHATTHSSGGTDPITHNNLAGLTTGDPHTQYKLESNELLTEDSVSGSTAITSYPTGVSMVRVTTSSTGWPVASTAFTVQTDRTANDRGFQLAVGAATNNFYIRYWDFAASAWAAWQDMSPSGSSYFFHGERTGSVQDMPSAGTWGTVIFNSQVEDVGNWYDPATGIATVPIAGLYVITAGIKWSTPASTETAQIGISKNAASPPVPVLHLERFGGAAEVTSQVTYQMRLAASDTVRIMTNVSLGAINVDPAPATHFQMRYLGAY